MPLVLAPSGPLAAGRCGPALLAALALWGEVARFAGGLDLDALELADGDDLGAGMCASCWTGRCPRAYPKGSRFVAVVMADR
jgi:hypothetical protein